ncbi:MAG: type II toxin-antitoxin system RelE/ParE family toxin [Candidatus Pseudobacter hemicellulosilyticus]|uniref:Type II toxin-antitoxin system RelE/ParE family toxin n=1 Tax=Candidatus Pseudobacter hemicellulosilyticus TaxID=3121375 RepID=A0AAJ6BGQ4_9BACT|nr:MAG: type II toxin-antitoxin system RelE/ParE family toxin [Pseudobacter sp.]
MEKENKELFSVILSSRSVREISSSWEWYEDRAEGLGDRFVENVKAKIAQVVTNPTHYSARYKDYREASIDTFPFQLIFHLNSKKKTVRILSVFHSARNPRNKYKVKK